MGVAFWGTPFTHYKAAATVQADDGSEDGAVVVLQEVVGIREGLRVQLTDLQDGWFGGVTEREELKMTPGFWAQTSGRMELKFPEMVKAGLGVGKREN